MTTNAYAKKNISIYWAEYDGNTKEYTDQLEAAFNKAHPGIELDIVRVAWSVLKKKLIASIAAKKEPNLTVAWGGLILKFDDEGLLEDMEPYVSAKTKANLNFTQMVGNRTLGLPMAAGSRILYYRKDLIPNPPSTFESMLGMAMKVHDPANKIFGMGIVGKKYLENVDFAYFLYGNGGSYFDKKSDGSIGKCAANSKEGVEALTFINDMVQKYKVTQPGVGAYDRADLQELFISGKLAFFLNNAATASLLKKANVSFEWDVAPMPYFEGKSRSSVVVFDLLTMFKRPGNYDEVGKFLDFFYKNEWRLPFDKSVGFPPVTKSLADDPYFATPVNQALIASNPGAKPWPLIAEWQEANDILWNNLEQVYQGSASPKEALDTACEEIDSMRGM
jgi:multiple sugar transport system substrate-binding protein